MKYDALEEQLKAYEESTQKSKDTRVNFFIQIIIVILSSIFLGVLGVISTYIWNGFVNSIQETQTQTQQTENIKSDRKIFKKL